MEKNIRISAVVGIDPGASGGVAIWRPGRKVEVSKMPKDISELRDYIEYIKGVASPIVFLEKLSVRPDDVVLEAGKVNMGKLFQIQKMMANLEQLKAMLVIEDVPYILVHPLKWQSALKLRQGKEDKAARKRRYRDVAQKLYPEVSAALWNSDALLIMHFGRYILKNDVNWVRENLPSGMHDRIFG